MNYSNTNDKPFIKYNSIPNEWKGVDGYNYATPEQLLKDGFLELKTPIYNPQTQYLGQIIKGKNDFTYEVLEFSAEQIQAKILADAEQQQTILAQKLALESVVNSQQEITDPMVNLANKAIFPFWSGDNVAYAKNIKVQSFDDKNEVWLYRCEQAHTSQLNWNPFANKALWTKVAPEGEVYKWVQPTGAQDAYKIGDKVWFPEVGTKKYESLINANTYSPTAYPAGWELVP